MMKNNSLFTLVLVCVFVLFSLVPFVAEAVCPSKPKDKLNHRVPIVEAYRRLLAQEKVKCDDPEPTISTSNLLTLNPGVDRLFSREEYAGCGWQDLTGITKVTTLEDICGKIPRFAVPETRESLEIPVDPEKNADLEQFIGNNEEQVTLSWTVRPVSPGSVDLDEKALARAAVYAASCPYHKAQCLVYLEPKAREGNSRNIGSQRFLQCVDAITGKGVKPEQEKPGPHLESEGGGVTIRCAESVVRKGLAVKAGHNQWFLRKPERNFVASAVKEITAQQKCKKITLAGCRPVTTVGEGQVEIDQRYEACRQGITDAFGGQHPTITNEESITRREAGLIVSITCESEEPIAVMDDEVLRGSVKEKSKDDTPPIPPKLAATKKPFVGSLWTLRPAMEIHGSSAAAIDLSTSRSTILTLPFVGFGVGGRLRTPYMWDFGAQLRWDRAKENAPLGIAPTYWGVEGMALYRATENLSLGPALRAGWGFAPDLGGFLSAQYALNVRIEYQVFHFLRLALVPGFGFESNARYETPGGQGVAANQRVIWDLTVGAVVVPPFNLLD